MVLTTPDAKPPAGGLPHPEIGMLAANNRRSVLRFNTYKAVLILRRRRILQLWNQSLYGLCSSLPD